MWGIAAKQATKQQSVLGHLYMPKFGMSREQRAQIIRATNGSSRFTDVEGIMRASDLEEARGDDRRQMKTGKCNAYVVTQKRDKQQIYRAEDDDSSELVDYENESSETAEDEVMAADGSDDSDDDETQEILEIHKKTKEKFRKAFRSYKESRKKVKEIRKGSQPFYPVVALNQPSSETPASSTEVPLQKQQFKYDRKAAGNPKRCPDQKGSRKEEANLTETSFIISFNYMVETNNTVFSEEILLTSTPMGFSILDTGCTTSVIGQECAERLIEFLKNHQLPLPEEKVLPPVELKGFSGEATSTTRGLIWYVKLGNTWGTISTYVIPGKTAFLLSRRVLEGMDAQIHVGRKMLSSEKHGISEMPLRQTSNGHLLMPLWELPDDWNVGEVHLEEVEHEESSHGSQPEEHEPNHLPTAASPQESAVPRAEDSRAASPMGGSPKAKNTPSKNKWGKRDKGVTMNDKRSALQHVAKNTKKGMVDIQEMVESLKTVFGG